MLRVNGLGWQRINHFIKQANRGPYSLGKIRESWIVRGGNDK